MKNELHLNDQPLEFLLHITILGQVLSAKRALRSPIALNSIAIPSNYLVLASVTRITYDMRVGRIE